VDCRISKAFLYALSQGSANARVFSLGINWQLGCEIVRGVYDTGGIVICTRVGSRVFRSEMACTVCFGSPVPQQGWGDFHSTLKVSFLSRKSARGSSPDIES
jgi:hypothetical protein